VPRLEFSKGSAERYGVGKAEGEKMNWEPETKKPRSNDLCGSVDGNCFASLIQRARFLWGTH
jgi:hypothetical protein